METEKVKERKGPNTLAELKQVIPLGSGNANGFQPRNLAQDRNDILVGDFIDVFFRLAGHQQGIDFKSLHIYGPRTRRSGIVCATFIGSGEYRLVQFLLAGTLEKDGAVKNLHLCAILLQKHAKVVLTGKLNVRFRLSLALRVEVRQGLGNNRKRVHEHVDSLGVVR